jgi:hypothetical protein
MESGGVVDPSTRPLQKSQGAGHPVFGYLRRSGAPGCHSEAVESLAKPRTPNEGSVHSGGDVARANCIDPEARKRRGPQDDSVDGGEGAGVIGDAVVFRAFVNAGWRRFMFTTGSSPRR